MAHRNQSAGLAGGLRDLGFDETPHRSAWADMLRAVGSRTHGPGGIYNLGNALGLGAGLALAVWSVGADQGFGGAVAVMGHYLAGSGSAVALTVATLIFFWGGEAYHRAWVDPERPDPVLNRQGDLLSAAGAMVLGLALALLGHPIMAATAGFLHAAGKLGSALHSPGAPGLPGWPRTWPDPFRSVVLVSRGPALLIAVLALAEGLSRPGTPIGEPLILLVCTIIWAKADFMLFRPAGPEPT